MNLTLVEIEKCVNKERQNGISKDAEMAFMHASDLIRQAHIAMSRIDTITLVGTEANKLAKQWLNIAGQLPAGQECKVMG